MQDWAKDDEPEEKVEMTGGVDAAAYGKAAGYSEDYATPKPATVETQLMTKAEEAGKLM